MVTPNSGTSTVGAALITPLRNERSSVEFLWNAIQQQTRPPDLWIICDNGSDDGTREWLEERIPRSKIETRLLRLPGKTIAQMLNVGIGQCDAGIVACCHGGTLIPSDWLENLLRPYEANDGIDVVSGVWVPHGCNTFERWVAASLSLNIDTLKPDIYLPASRSIAFTRKAWLAVGGFPEWLPKFGEDLLYDLRLMAAGCRFRIAKDALVYWRPPPNYLGLLRQHRLYNEANGIMGFHRPIAGYFVRPYAMIALAVSAAVMLGPSSGIAAFILLLGLDFARFSIVKRTLRVDHYVLWFWIITVVQQLGLIRGTLWRLSGRYRVPPSDAAAIASYLRRVGRPT